MHPLKVQMPGEASNGASRRPASFLSWYPHCGPTRSAISTGKDVSKALGLKTVGAGIALPATAGRSAEAGAHAVRSMDKRIATGAGRTHGITSVVPVKFPGRIKPLVAP